MYCPSCGKQIPDQARFCPHCGAAAGRAPAAPAAGPIGAGTNARAPRPAKAGGRKGLSVLVTVLVLAAAAAAAVMLLRGRSGGGSADGGSGGHVQSNLYVGRRETVLAGDYILGSTENSAGDIAVFRLTQDASGYYEKSEEYFTGFASQFVNVNGVVYALVGNADLCRIDPERMASEVVYRPPDGKVGYIAGVADGKVYFVTVNKPVYGGNPVVRSDDYPCLQHLNADGSVETDFKLPDDVTITVCESGVYRRYDEGGGMALCDFTGRTIADVGYSDRSYNFLRESDKYVYFNTDSGIVCADKKTGQLVADLRAKMEAQYPDMFSSLYSWDIDCYEGQLYVLAMDPDQRTVLYKVDEDGQDFKAQVVGQTYLDHSTNNHLWVVPFMVDSQHCLIQVSDGTRDHYWDNLILD